jgi:ATP-dependent helicase/nuclease subunit B
MSEPAGSPAPRIFTVPPGRPFLTCLAEALLAGDLPSPGGTKPDLLTLPDVTLLMPTRRATRALQEAFLAAGGGQAMLLPAIRPISEADEELSLLTELAGLTSAHASARDIAPAIPDMERRLTLTRLVLAWSERMRDANADEAGEKGMGMRPEAGAGTPAQAAMLAADLARLMDLVETEGASFDNIDKLVGADHSEHWEKTIQFLEIVTSAWPRILAASGRLSPMDRRNKLILAEARRLTERPPSAPVIVAGVTGSIPATAELMRAVAGLPNGAIVLPALDLDLDDDSWNAIAPAEKDAEHHPEHPQYGLKRLLDRLGVSRKDVRALGDKRTDHLKQRHSLLSEAMRPAATTGRWHDFVEHADRSAVSGALDGLSLIEAPGAQDEAEVVALILRHAAETPRQTAALVSPDRLLARRVAVRLEAWGIRVDDSAGRPFPKTVPGAFLDLVVGAVTHDFAPPELMALLKHPLTRLGLDPFAARRAARALEVAAFRAPYLGRGLDGAKAALARAEEARQKKQGSRALLTLWPEDMANAHNIVERLAAAVEPLTALYAARDPKPLRALLAAHLAAAEAMVKQPLGPDGKEPPSELYIGEAGQAAAQLFAELTAESQPALDIAPADYADLYRSLVSTLNVRPKIPVHPRLFIWGPLEARLQQADVLVLGSLNDGTWPESADPGPWLNRPMRAELGLPAPEEKIGYAAHDFTTLAGAPRVFLTRATKVDGVPTVESRWLLRLKSLLAALELSDKLQPSEPWLGWALNRDEAKRTEPLPVPEPRPPLALRPRRLSVSGVETWIANPYAIYARNILKLEALPVLGTSPDAALRGGVVHEALARFAKAFPDRLPRDARQQLIGFAREVLTEYTGHPRVAAFWLPRLERFAEWFVDTEPARRDGVTKLAAELSGSLSFEAPGGPFTLTARADRIDRRGDGLVITDYKTGAFPNDKRVTQGEAPQLPLEAAIAAAGSGFEGFSPARVAALRYIRASGGEPAGEEHDVKCDDIAALATRTVDDLKKLVAAYDDESTAYRPLRRARFTYDYDDYAHLARVAEWSASDTSEGGEA